MTCRPSFAMIEALTKIWERVLGCSPIGADDNFFEVGGNSLAAGMLFSEIEKSYSRRLVSAAICRVPTIAALAVELEHPTISEFERPCLLRSGSGAEPAFIAPGLGSNVVDFYPLVKQLDSNRPIYGLQTVGIDGIGEPFETIEATAQFHLDAIKAQQPKGPYFLIGYSLGGLITLEIAQRLIAAGNKIALLAMLDSFPHRMYLSFSRRLWLARRLVANDVSNALGISTPRADPYSAASTPDRARSLAGRRLEVRSQSRDAQLLARAVLTTTEFGKMALKRYRPRYYPGEIKFVRAAKLTNFPGNPVAVWAHLARKFEVETIPCDHFGMIETHTGLLARIISRYLRGASSE